MPSIQSQATTTDGTAQLVRRWPPAGSAAVAGDLAKGWASVLLVHGLSDHSGRYEHVGDRLAAAGLDVHAFDFRGNGGSGGRRGDAERWSQLHDDLAERLEAVRAASGGRPVVLYGHSMGGLIVLGYLLGARPRPDIVVVTSPALESTLAGWRKALARWLARTLPTMSIPNGIEGAMLSRDPEVAARVAADPAATRTSTTRFGAAGLAEQVRVRREIRRLPGDLPMLVLHGLGDQLVPAAASEILGTLTNVERRTYPGLRHELHNEPEGPAILDEVIGWLRGKVEGVPIGRERTTIAGQPNIASGERLER